MRERPLKVMMLVILTWFLIVVVPVSAIKTAEQTADESMTRGSRFTVTITGLPNSSYYLWIPHTSSMTGEPGDQPPVIADFQRNVLQDPAGGPWPIGSYQYQNGNGQTIRDDIPPSVPDMPNTRYYALVTTDSYGQATVEFQTSISTGLRSYSVKAESPRSKDSDTLLVELRVYSRKAPVVREIFTTLQPILTTVIPTPESPPVVPTLPVTTLQEPVQPFHPAHTPASKSPLDTGTLILAAALCLFLMRRH